MWLPQRSFFRQHSIDPDMMPDVVLRIEPFERCAVDTFCGRPWWWEAEGL